MSHRLIYFPWPLAEPVDPSDFSDPDFDLADFILETAQDPSNIRLVGPVRFDFAPNERRENHSSSHIHFAPEARCAVAGPVHPSLFFRHIVSLFYPDHYTAIAKPITPTGFGTRTLTDDEPRLLYVESH